MERTLAPGAIALTTALTALAQLTGTGDGQPHGCPTVAMTTPDLPTPGVTAGSWARETHTKAAQAPDAPTRELMSRFYAHVAQGESTPQALNRAQREMADADQPAYVWAAFTVTGE